MQVIISKAGEAKSSKISSRNDADELSFYLNAKIDKKHILANDKISNIIKNRNPIFYRNAIETVTIKQKITINMPSNKLKCLNI